MTKPGQDPEDKAEELRDLSPREDDSAELKGGVPPPGPSQHMFRPDA